jgi:hypothetical protein
MAPYKADNLSAISEPIDKKMWEPQNHTTLWAFTACYRGIFTFFPPPWLYGLLRTLASCTTDANSTLSFSFRIHIFSFTSRKSVSTRKSRSSRLSL